MARFRSLLAGSTRVLGFTGAGISTESGIPDYRSKGGVWDRFTPVYFQEFLREPEKRKLYWRRKKELWPDVARAQPNEGHLFFRRLHDRGALLGIVTQNVDGLHEKSGVPPEKIVTIHGNARRTVCLSCERSFDSAEIYEWLQTGTEVPRCPSCDGLLKPDTISFGQSLRQDDIRRAEDMARECDLVIAVGSTLVVQPAASIPLRAKRAGAGLIILTLSQTPLDDEADLVVRRPIGEFLASLD